MADQNLITKLKNERKTARDFQERRHDDWNENYELYRNRVFTNRLTQRQSVNIPLMKETVKTLLSKIDEPPTVEWRELVGNQEKEIIFQEIWNTVSAKQNFEGIDIQDKKSVLLYGRSFKKLNWVDNQVDIKALDVFDVVIDPLTDPLDIETARFIIHQNIYRTLREILADDRYTAEGKDQLRIWAATNTGIVQSNDNKKEAEEKQERLRAMGVSDDEFPLFAGGDVIVNLCEHYTQIWNTKKKAFERRVIVYAQDEYVLLNETLEDLLGVTYYPFVSWAEDIETSDFWSDSPADLVRTPNKVINIWFSQLVENRTLRNFQMVWFDATVQGYQPQTYDPGPGRMLPAPGDPNKTIMPVPISGLDETLNSIDFIIKLVERGTSATAIEKGVSERSQITLGEVNMLVGKAMERTLAMAKLYRRSWEELAMKWSGIFVANAKKTMTLYKTSRTGKLWPLKVYPIDWRSNAGFEAKVSSSSEQEDDKTKAVQRFQFLLAQFPNNQALKRIAQRRMLDIANLTAEEIREITEEEKKSMEAVQEVATEREAQSQSPLVDRAEKLRQAQDNADLEDKLGELVGAAETQQTPETQKLNELVSAIA